MNFVLNIVDFYVEVETMCSKTGHVSDKYVSLNPPRIDFSVKTSEADIEFERSIVGNKDANSIGLLEFTALQRKIAEEMLSRGAFLMHGALIEYDGKGYLFTANSGVGKTTHISLWQKVFGEDNVKIINGDKPFIRIIGDNVFAYGTPWCGKENLSINKRVPLAAVCFIERAAENSIIEIDTDIALPLVMGQSMIHDSKNLAAQLALFDQMFERVRFYKLKCNMDDSAAIVAKNALVKENG